MTRAALAVLLATSGATIGASGSPGASAGVLDADDMCHSGGLQECAPATSLLQVQAAPADKSQRHRQGARAVQLGSKVAMVHVPCNFGHTIEIVALNNPSFYVEPFEVPEATRSFQASLQEEQWQHIRAAAGPDAEFWGMVNPDLRILSNATGCDMFYTPQMLWPEGLAASYFGNSTVLGMLRNPYDRVVNEFRMQLTPFSAAWTNLTHAEVSRREGHGEKEQEPYTTWYKTCDVNAWVKAELVKYKTGDKYRGNCHLLPQAEFFRGPYGISQALDVATFPSSFNKAMKEHGSPLQTTSIDEVAHNEFCPVSAWSLDEEAIALIQEVYAEDFELNCKHFGLCDVEAKSCVCEVPDMCGGAPADACATKTM